MSSQNLEHKNWNLEKWESDCSFVKDFLIFSNFCFEFFQTLIKIESRGFFVGFYEPTTEAVLMQKARLSHIWTLFANVSH